MSNIATVGLPPTGSVKWDVSCEKCTVSVQ